MNLTPGEDRPGNLWLGATVLCHDQRLTPTSRRLPRCCL